MRSKVKVYKTISGIRVKVDGKGQLYWDFGDKSRPKAPNPRLAKRRGK